MSALSQYGSNNCLSYYLQQFASICATPICLASEAFHHLISPIPKEDSSREKYLTRVIDVLLVSGAFVVGIPTGALHLTARLVHQASAQQAFVHMRGRADFLPNVADQLTLMSWNVCVIAGGFSKSTGGMEHWSQRIKGIEAKIKRNDPDILCLYEVQDTDFFNALFHKLKDQYAECYTFLGAHPYKAISGVVIFSKVRSSFNFTTFKVATGSASWENKGFAHMVIGDKIQCVFTHLQHGSGNLSAVARNAQVEQIIKTVDQLDLPTILSGDLNTDASSEEFKLSQLNAGFKHGNNIAKTWTSFYIRKNWLGQTCPKVFEKKLDYICERTKVESKTKLTIRERNVRAYSTSAPFWCLSDHHAIFASIKISSTSDEQIPKK